MISKPSFLAGVVTGYVLGAKAGRKRYEQIRQRAVQAWSSEPVQERVDSAVQALRSQAPVLAEKVGQKVGSAARSAGSSVRERVQGEDLPETLHRGTDGRLHADTTGFGPGPGKLP